MSISDAIGSAAKASAAGNAIANMSSASSSNLKAASLGNFKKQEKNQILELKILTNKDRCYIQTSTNFGLVLYPSLT